MPDLIIVKLHPAEPVTADVFRQALTGLTLTAYDLTFDDSAKGVAIGTASGVADPHVPPGGLNPVDNTVDVTKTQIIQYYQDIVVGLNKLRVLQSAAVAVIVAKPPAGHHEYPATASYDLRLELDRSGTAIVDKTIDFNIAITTVSTVDSDQRAYLAMTAAAYATLPPVAGAATIELPQDGTPPNFAKLVTAVDGVLAKDPADGHALKERDQLSAAQSLQIASELIWDRKVYPPPAEPRSLGEMYTKPPDGSAMDTNADNDRQKFEGKLSAYYATHSAEAAKLATFVHAAWAAMRCEMLSAGKTLSKAGASGEDLVGAPLAAFPFPIITGAGAPLDTAVALRPTAGPSITDRFIVPAAYFYALATAMPPQIAVGQRYDMARFDAEAKILQEIQTAIDAGAVAASEKASTQTTSAINPAQSARRLHALGTVAGALPEVVLDPGFAVLVSDWLARTDATADLDTAFWPGEVTAHPAEYLSLVLRVVTGGWQPLIDAVTTGTFGASAPPWPVTSVAALVAVTDQQWRDLLLKSHPPLALLPPFTNPGTPAQRAEAFIRHLRKFFTVPLTAVTAAPSAAGAPPALHQSTVDVFGRFAAAYAANGGGTFTFGTARDVNASAAAIGEVLPDDPAARAWLAETLDIMDALCTLTAFATAKPLRFSLMEALYARGFTSVNAVRARSEEDFRAALAGTVAYPFASEIQTAAGGSTATGTPEPGPFVPVNPDGGLTDCVPPGHLSPFGPVAYLHELLRASALSTCDNPGKGGDAPRLGALLATRRGPLGDLSVTRANLETPLPVADLVNESLEALTATVSSGKGALAGAVYDTASEGLAGHTLRDHEGGKGHDPATLFAALPEHSSPAAVDLPAAETAAYAALRRDFSAPELPYDQPLDVERSFLDILGTTRFSAMRHFRKRITEFVLDPENEPDGFAAHLWRYPVRFDIAREYLGISADEYSLLYAKDLADTPGEGKLALYEVYGFSSSEVNERSWSDLVLSVPEFLRRTGLTYCEFLELRRCGFVPFFRASFREGAQDGEDPNGGFPVCEPCCLDDLRIAFPDGEDDMPVETALRKLAVFIRLWWRLGCASEARPGPRIDFALLADLADALHLFQGDTINPDFLRQLAALSMLAAELRLDDVHPLLDLLAGPGPEWNRAAAILLDAVEDRAQAEQHCRRREPEFMKIVADNLGPLSVLAGFAPGADSGISSTWYAHPTHLLRFTEVLGKIYASEFTVGEILFLFTAADHLDGDDPFPLADRTESLDDPLALPEAGASEGDGEHSLWALRRALLEVHVDEHDARRWSWSRIAASLREEFGFPSPAGMPDPLLDLGKHFFPHEVRRCGHSVDPAQQQYRTLLAAGSTSPHMWLAPPDGPFGYDESTEHLWTRLPVRDIDVIERLRELRPLRPEEQTAVRNLYFAPRAALAPFAAIFENFDRAVDRLVQEPDEHERFAFFQRQYALFHRRCRVIAAHLAAHVCAQTGGSAQHGDNENMRSGDEAAWRILRTLLADENLANTPWEDDSGEPPEVTWPGPPAGGAFAALLGLTGTGLLGEFCTAKDDPAWRETRGGLRAFGVVRDEHNAPVPTVIPTLDLELTPEQLQFVGVRNGFAFADSTGEPLGGAQPFTVRWSGVLLVERRGEYRFHAGAPCRTGHGAGEQPDFEAARHNRWRVSLGRGQKTWTMLNHCWPGEEEAPPNCSLPVSLRRGAYRITVDFEQREPDFSRAEDICPARTGFQLSYAGPDSDGELTTVPFDRLFRDTKDRTLGDGVVAAQVTLTPGLTAQAIGEGEQAAAYLDRHYPSTLRDIRRTYQRAYKALLFARRFRLSARPVTGYRTSELGFLLEHPESFQGTAYYREGSGFTAHHAWFDFDLLPVSDPYPPAALQSASGVVDQRSAPSPHRQAALFDWWERVFDYCRLRAGTRGALERPAWLLFAEVAEQQPDDPAELLRHLGVDLRHAPLVLRYFAPDSVPPIYFAGTADSADLTDERWAVRVWHADAWLRALRRHFLPASIEKARPALWAADDPGIAVDAPPWISPPESGNANLTRFVQDGFFEHGDPRRYAELQRCDDALRDRARTALIAYLCARQRLALPWKTDAYAATARDLSDFLLQDVSCVGERVTRIEDAIGAVQTFVQRARLGLEPDFVVRPEFARLWERRLGTYRTWVAARRREIYREDWIEWDDLHLARRSEAFRFLEEELRRGALTVAVPGGGEWWPATSGARPPVHAGLSDSETLEPAELRLLDPVAEGLGLLGDPEHAGRPSWLAPVSFLPSGGSNGGGTDDGPGTDTGRKRTTRRKRETAAGKRSSAVTVTGLSARDALAGTDVQRLPLWLRAAADLGVSFVRVAAAGEPPASARFTPRHHDEPHCPDCYDDTPPVVDEYYFWLADAKFFTAGDVVQNAGTGLVDPDPEAPDEQISDWHRPEKLPGLLHWEPEPRVHLYWSRLHHGEFEPPRRSGEGVAVTTDSPMLRFDGRGGDSLSFTVVGPSGVPQPTPIGYGDYPGAPPPGFRYDLATDSALVMPLVAPPPVTPEYLGLAAYPFFAFVEPGAPIVPASLFSVAMTVAGALRTRCGFEAALKWYELAYRPLAGDNTWARCQATLYPPGPTLEQHSKQDVPCCPSAPVSDEEARARAVLLSFAETLVRWGESLLCRKSGEASRQAAVVFDTLRLLLGPRPRTVLARDDVGAPRTIATFQARPAPLNPRLVRLYDRVTGCVTDRAASLDECCDGPYRFAYLLPKAVELAGEVRNLGAELLAAYEKGDAEAIAALRSAHERQVLELTLRTRQYQWREADWQVQGLQQAKEGALTRLRYYEQLILRGLNAGETAYQSLTEASMVSRTTGNISEAIAQGIGLFPDMWLGVAGMGPLQANQLPVGAKLANASFSTAARIMNTLADIAATSAGLNLTQAGWQRRLEEWQHLAEVTGIEIEQIERQILAAERHRDAALRELDTHQRQIEHAAEMQDFLRDKFTNQELYLYLHQETAACHRRLYEVALHTARRAQRAFAVERGYPAHVSLPDAAWDNLHEGLAAGERLQTALRQLELAYTDANCREYELTKHVSLRLDFPVAFLRLRTTGTAEIELPEWLFDLDYSGHYLRRVKNVTVSVPCVVGPYVGVHCRLTLLGSTTRVEPTLIEPPASCCDDQEECRCGNGYRARPGDPRLAHVHAATEAIATSTGQNDSGMFELNFRDERYLPFEYAGAVSRWRIELPPENNRFDFDTLADVVLHLNYTARDGGEALRHAAGELARRHLPGAGLRLFDVRHDFPDDWYRLTGGDPHLPRRLPLRLGREHFPFVPGRPSLRLTRLDLFVEAGDHHRAEVPVRFVTEHEIEHGEGEECRCSGHVIACVPDGRAVSDKAVSHKAVSHKEAADDEVVLYHGSLEVALGPLRACGDRELGVFHFPSRCGLDRLYLVCRYERG